jgi:hypothetical protein
MPPWSTHAGHGRPFIPSSHIYIRRRLQTRSIAGNLCLLLFLHTRGLPTCPKQPMRRLRPIATATGAKLLQRGLCCSPRMLLLITDVGSMVWGGDAQGYACGACPLISYTLLPFTVTVCWPLPSVSLAINQPVSPHFSLAVVNIISSLIAFNCSSYRSNTCDITPAFKHRKGFLRKRHPNSITSTITMQYTNAIILAVAGLAAAQSTTSSAATSSASADSQSGCGTAIDAYD